MYSHFNVALHTVVIDIKNMHFDFFERAVVTMFVACPVKCSIPTYTTQVKNEGHMASKRAPALSDIIAFMHCIRINKRIFIR